MPKPPPLPPGYSKHHIVVLEGVHVAMPPFSIPHTIDVYPRTPSPQVLERIKSATIVITCIEPITPAHLDACPNLKCVCVMAVGMSWLDRHAFADRGITVTNTPGANVEAVREHVLALYFTLRKRVVECDQRVKAGREWMEKNTLTRDFWDGPPLGVAQEVVGVLGYGSLGTGVEKVFKALGCKEVLIAERKGRDSLRQGRTAFDEVIKASSVIVVCVPKDDDTIGLVGELELSMMRKEAVVINVARGGIVNEAALARALKERRIFGGATDVTETEPGGAGTSPLLPDKEKGDEEVPNFIVSPHVAWFTQVTIANYLKMIQEGVDGFANGTLGEDQVIPHVAIHNGKVWR